VRAQERLDLGPQRRVAAAGCAHVAEPLVACVLERGAEHVLDARPALGGHAPSSRYSQAFASCHSRFTVAVEMPSTSAVSSTERPPKKRSSTTWH
jgi:hypothetical protein